MPIGKLTALKVKSLTQPGRYGDGGGLWLQVRDADHRSWLFRYMIGGRARQMGLGPLHDVSLADARDAAQAARRLLREGRDPIDTKAAAKTAAQAAVGLPFRDVADRYITAHEASWRNSKHRAQWRSTLDSYAFPLIGSRPVNLIDTGDVMRVLEPIWHEKAETAARVRGRIEAVLDFAKARGWRSGENPARWRGHLSNLLPARARISKVEHHPALPWAQAGRFMADLRREESVSALALQFVILTAARTGEVLGARWPEIDLAEKVWTVPAERMKAGVEHRVPLSSAALAVLKAAKMKAGDDGLVFPGVRPGKSLSDMALTMLLRRMDRGDITTHGFRSTFRDWVSESTVTAASEPLEIRVDGRLA